MKKILKRLVTGFLAFATIVTALPTTAVHASEKQYWTESAERVGIVEKVMNDGSIGSTFNEGHMTVEGEDAFCVDINTNFRNGYKTRADASTRMSYDQISDVALSIEYVNPICAEPQRIEQSAYLPFETMRRMAEIECSSGLAMRITSELPMMKSQKPYRTRFTLGRKSLPARIKDAMNVAVTSTLARGRTLDSSGETCRWKCHIEKDFQ